MQANIEAALSLILRWEGPEVNKSSTEPGGISKYGISLQTYTEFQKKLNLPVPTMDDIANLTEDQARQFYSNTFLPAMRFNDLPSGVDIRLVDISINLGITGAINTLELVLLQWPLKGQITDDLIKTINSYNSRCIVLALSAAFISNKHTKPTWNTFGHGWTNRNIDATQKSLGLV